MHRQAHVKWCSHQGKTKINLEEFTLSVTSYISMYINDNYNKITPDQKANEIKCKVRALSKTFSSGDKEAYNKTRLKGNPVTTRICGR